MGLDGSCTARSADEASFAHNSGGDGKEIWSCILRRDVIDLRNSTRVELENRTRLTQIRDGIKNYFGFRCHSKVSSLSSGIFGGGERRGAGG